MSYNPGTGPYNNPQVTISTPLSVPPQQLTNVQTLLTANVAGVMLFWNGVLLTSPADYTISGSLVTMVTPPASGDILTARIFPIGLQLGGLGPTRYVAPWTFVLAGDFDGVGVVYQIVEGPTIFGTLDGINNLFTWQVTFQRVQIFRNGMLQTSGNQVNAGATCMAFLPGWIPQPGDALTVLGYN